VHWLGDDGVGPRFERVEVARLALVGREDEEKAVVSALVSCATTELEMIDTRDVRIEECDLRRVLALQNLPRFGTARGDDHLVSPGCEVAREGFAGLNVVVGDENSLHVGLSAPRYGTPRRSLTRNWHDDLRVEMTSRARGA